ncbi:MAG: 3-hydroxyacyl-ACP dehydratase FabZ [Candidatus Dadabacteria bacterium]|nr:3-hydroxyacyl-ACP dehydratase FabZ [Candidatus Dadabacteria bacterium]NIQ14346.1 3-hydroxyacyl-ACP dehydratase FabZ [Candidatus Dadabacteria bacterium]
MILDTEEIKLLLPHREPFLFVDSVTYIEPGVKIVAEKTFGDDEFFFPGHFPGNPIVPGVIITEAIAQTGGILFNYSFKEDIEKNEFSNAYLIGLDNCKFRTPVLPNDKAVFEVELVKRRSRILVFAGKATVNDKRVAEAQITASLV